VAAADLVTAISDALPDIKSGSLAVFGDIFGGRVDNTHCVVGAVANDDGSATIQFDGGESLIVWEPSGIEVSPTQFRIARASRVRWEWFYYGRPQTPENRYFIDHEVSGTTVIARDNVDWAPSTSGPSLLRPAVELLP
jgi:hypothetical protein